MTTYEMTVQRLCAALSSHHASAAACCRELSALPEAPPQAREDIAVAAKFFSDLGRGAIRTLMPMFAPLAPPSSDLAAMGACGQQAAETPEWDGLGEVI